MFDSLSQSSALAHVCGSEEFFSRSDAETVIPDTNAEPQPSSTYDLRPRGGIKLWENITPSKIPKTRRSKRRERKTQKLDYDTEMGICSQESVSLLQECYDRSNEITNTNEDLDVTRSPQRGTAMENLLQVELNVEKQKEIVTRSKFISCVVRLKFMLSSRIKKADGDLNDVINSVKSVFGENIGEVYARDAALIKGTTEEFISTLPDCGSFCDTAQTLLLHLESILEENLLEIAGAWRSSVYELAVDLLNEAVQCDLQIQKSVEFFLFKLLKSILNDKERSKNLALESKALLALTLSKSTGLSFSLICFVIGQLKRLKTKPLCLSLADKLYWLTFVKNLYVLLRVLEVALNSVKTKLENKEIDGVLNEEEAVKNVNVFEMWKTRWGGEDTSRKTNATCPGKLVISNWLNELDQALVYCVNHFPISAMAVDRCRFLVVGILKICNANERLETEETKLHREVFPLIKPDSGAPSSLQVHQPRC